MSTLATGHPLVRHGTVVDGRYKIIRTLGEGGAGLVFEAEQLSVGRSVALKVLRLDRWSEDAVKRFGREARALGKVRSVRVLQVLEQGNDRDIGPYLVTELSEGEMLSERLRRETVVDSSHFMTLARALVEALADVHDAGLLHRDIKPSNIAVPKRGPIAAKLLDFGLATGIDPHAFSRLTKTDDVVGSLPYVAPEVFDGEPASIRSDIWSLGVVFYEMLSGQRPFSGESSASLMKSILTHDVNWERLPSELPRGVVLLCQRMLARDPEERPKDCAELLAALYSPGVHVAPAPGVVPATGHAHAALKGALAGAAMVALLFTGWWWVFAKESRAPPESAMAPESAVAPEPREAAPQRPDRPTAKAAKTAPDEAIDADDVAANTKSTLASRPQRNGGRPSRRVKQPDAPRAPDDDEARPAWQGGVIKDYP